MDKKITKPNHKFKKGIIAMGALLAIILLISAFYNGKSKTLNVDAGRIMTARVEEGIFKDYIPLDGVVQPIKTVILNSIEAGYVEEKFAEEGGIIKQGDPILKLSNNDLLLDFMNREALLLDQMNNMRNTRISLDQNHIQLRQQLLDIEHSFLEKQRLYVRNKHLYEEKVIAIAEFERSEDEFIYLQNKRKLLLETIKKDSVFKQNQVIQLESNSNLIERNLSMVKKSLDNLIIKAPVSGQLTALTAEIGEYKGKGQALGQVDVLEGYKIRANADEHYISKIQKGQRGEFTFNSNVYQVIVDKIFPQVNNGQFAIDLIFENQVPEGLKQGQSFSIKLAFGGNTSALMLKRGSFYQSTSGSWVFVVKDGAASKKQVKLGRQNPEFYEVISGLNAGEEVIISSYEAFSDAEELNFNK
jgi:HlyD family secretion protein